MIEERELREKESEANEEMGKGATGIRILRVVGWFGLLLALPFFFVGASRLAWLNPHDGRSFWNCGSQVSCRYNHSRVTACGGGISRNIEKIGQWLGWLISKY